MWRFSHRFSASSLAMTAVFLAGCAVGPDFETPAAPDVSSYDSTETSSATADYRQNLQVGEDIPAEWWALFHSDNLDKLIVQALRDNPDLASAEASLRVAEDNLAAGNSDLFPSITGQFASEREKTSPASSGGFAPSTLYTLHNASVSVSYGLDIFGGTRRAIEQLQAQTDYARFQREAVYLTLTSNVVTSAIQEASLREQIASTQEMVTDQEKILKIVQARFEAGAVPKSIVTAQQGVLATTKAELPALQHQLAVTRHALTALVGQLPAHAPKEEFALSQLTLPMHVPLSVPSKLVEQRPDIKAAEQDLHAATAAIGVAVANRLPQITLSADIGTAATQLGKLLTPGSGFWAFGGSAAETLFDAGALADKEDAARDTLDMAAAEYRKAVLGAFQDVADTLHALQSDAESLNATILAEKATADTLELTKTEFEAGSITATDLLNAEQSEQQSKISLTKANAQRYADTAALFTALGGGWWNRDKAQADSKTEASKKGSL